MEKNEVQRVRSTLSHIPDRLQVLLIMVVVLGQPRVWVVPAGVFDQERNSVVSAWHLPVAACVRMCDKREGTIWGEQFETHRG